MIEDKIYKRQIKKQLISHLVDLNFFSNIQESKIKSIEKIYNKNNNDICYYIKELYRNEEWNLTWHIYSDIYHHRETYNFIKKYEKYLDIKNEKFRKKNI